MPQHTDYHDLVCPQCRRRETLPPSQMLARLRAAGLMKRAKDPDPGTVLELLKVAAAGWPCPACGARGLAVEPTPDELADEDWGQAKPCERCGKPIPPERLELFPNTKLCMKCQQQAEAGDEPAEAEFCPRCGSIMELRRSRDAGIARYVMQCPQCRR